MLEVSACAASIYFRYGAFLLVIIFNILIYIKSFKFHGGERRGLGVYLFLPWRVFYDGWLDVKGGGLIVKVGVVTYLVGVCLWVLFFSRVDPFFEFMLHCDKSPILK